jgi:hypothetical protein
MIKTPLLIGKNSWYKIPYMYHSIINLRNETQTPQGDCMKPTISKGCLEGDANRNLQIKLVNW